MDIKLNIKGLSVIRGQIKVDDLDVGFSCSEGETVNCNEASLEMLNNPAVQGFLKKLTEEVSFKPSQPQQNNNRNAQHQDNRKVYQEAQQRQVQEHQNAAIQKMLETISRQLDRLANHRNF